MKWKWQAALDASSEICFESMKLIFYPRPCLTFSTRNNDFCYISIDYSDASFASKVSCYRIMLGYFTFAIVLSQNVDGWDLAYFLTLICGARLLYRSLNRIAVSLRRKEQAAVEAYISC